MGLSTENQTEKSFLLQLLNRVQRKRKQLEQKASPALQLHLNEWNFRVSSSEQYHQVTLSKLEALMCRKCWTEEEYQFTSKWHVLSDVFLIWHRGPFGTVNGFRLGKSFSTNEGHVEKCTRGGYASLTAGQLRIGGGFFVYSGNNGTAISHAQQFTSENNTVGRGTKKITVPWNEINSALGQLLFFLHTMQNSSQSGIFFRNYVLKPCGSASKIGVIKKEAVGDMEPQKFDRRKITTLAAQYNSATTGTTDGVPKSLPLSQISSNEHSTFPIPVPNSVIWYNLYHYDENGSVLSMGYYARRNFNIALKGLLHCIAEACLVVEKRDMALAAPIIMRINGLVVGKDGHSSNGIGYINDELGTLGGLPLAYDPSTGEQWTMVCKFLMTNLNWLVAYVAKHVDR